MGSRLSQHLRRLTKLLHIFLTLFHYSSFNSFLVSLFSLITLDETPLFILPMYHPAHPDNRHLGRSILVFRFSYPASPRDSQLDYYRTPYSTSITALTAPLQILTIQNGSP